MTLELLKKTGFPLAAPSANPSGEKSPKTADEVFGYFDGAIGGIIDGGECSLGVESSIIDLSETPYRILREGAVSMQDINKTLSDSLTIIGITGGTGCGKTTALNALEKLGALVIDCDAVYHDITVSDKDMKDEIIRRFGDVYDGDVLNRKALGNIVFGDSGALNALNEITHKYVNREVDRRLTDWALRGGKYAAIDAIALIGTEIAARCRSLVGIIAPTEARVARLIAREGIEEVYARKRIEAQPTNEYFAENCDYVLMNDGTMEQFEDKCTALFSKLLEEN
jgi:dephospho-CoA kinase